MPSVVDNLLTIDLLFFRMMGFFAVCPYFKESYIPTKVGPMLAVLFTALFSTYGGLESGATLTLADHFKYCILNTCVGLLAGSVALLAFETVKIASKAIAIAMQLSFSQMVDPANGGEGDPASAFLYIVFTLVFIASGGLLTLFDILAMTLHVIPLTGISVSQAVMFDIAVIFGQTFAYGLVLASPFIMLKLLVYIGLGVISKAATNINLFASSFPLSILLGMFALVLAMPTLTREMLLVTTFIKSEFLGLFH